MITPEQRQAAAEEILEELEDAAEGLGTNAGTAFAIVHRLLSPQSVTGNLIRAEALRDAARDWIASDAFRDRDATSIYLEARADELSKP